MPVRRQSTRKPPRTTRQSSFRRAALNRLGRNLQQTSTTIRTHRAAFSALLTAGLIVFAIAAWPFSKDHLEAIAVLDQVSSHPVPALVGNLVAHPISTEDTIIETESGPVRARLYLPELTPEKSAAAPALIVLHGVHHLGIDEPRLISFASAMASCGIRVLTPELPDIKDYHVDSTSIKTIGESTQWFAARTGGPVGVMGLSFSGGLALVAAADPLYKKSFKFVFAVGSQDSMSRVSQYYRTGSDERPNGTIELLPAHEYGPLVLEYEYLEDFLPARDIPAVRSVLRAHLYEDKVAETLAETRLTPSQKIASAQLMDTTSPKTRALINDAITKHSAELAGLSPDSHLALMTTPVYLLHGQADNIIPSAETLWMASELPSVTLQAMLVSPVISHIDFEGARPGLWDQWRLIHFFALIMHATETPSGRSPGL